MTYNRTLTFLALLQHPICLIQADPRLGRVDIAEGRHDVTQGGVALAVQEVNVPGCDDAEQLGAHLAVLRDGNAGEAVRLLEQHHVGNLEEQIYILACNARFLVIQVFLESSENYADPSYR